MRRPISFGVDAVDHEQSDMRTSNLHLLRDCLALGTRVDRRPPAMVRLVVALGPALARWLVQRLAAKRP
jgi:hypothetical protein